MKVPLINSHPIYKDKHKNASNIPFKGRFQYQRELSKQITENSSKFIKFITKLGKNNGEILNIIVTTIGTACVAPIFISFNPFSKEDKETKVYSAMRQPISAVLSFALQMGVNLRFNRWLDKLSSTGELDKINLRANPAPSYLKKIIKSENPKIKRKELAQLIEDRQDIAFMEEVAKARKLYKSNNIDYVDLIDNGLYKKAEKQVKEELKDQIASLGKKDAAKFIESETVKKASNILKNQLESEAKIKHRISRFVASKRPFDDVMKELKEVVKLDGLDEKTMKEVKRIIEKLEDMGSFKNYKHAGENYKQILQSVKIKKMIVSQISNSQQRLKNFKKWGGISLSLITLPLSCGLLNWAYPRIMEKLMPEASQKKKQKDSEVKK